VGVFFNQVPVQRMQVHNAILDALRTDPAQVQNPDAEAQNRTDAAITPPASYAAFNTGRFIGAILIFGALVGAAIGSDAAGLADSQKALYGLAASVFGVVIGFLGGEKSAAG
jgi:hypothetical protein